jgi:hypothetical protein
MRSQVVVAQVSNLLIFLFNFTASNLLPKINNFHIYQLILIYLSRYSNELRVGRPGFGSQQDHGWTAEGSV